jgi:adenylate cyclase
MGGDPEQDFFSDGIAEDIITELSRSRSLFVIARNSSFTYKGHPVDVRQVGRELGVRYVLEGSVRRSGSRVRVVAQLIEAETGNHVWAERYDRDVSEIFGVQDEVTAAIISAILPALSDTEQQGFAETTGTSQRLGGLPARSLAHGEGQSPRSCPGAALLSAGLRN